MADRTSCYECGEELWSVSESNGYCVGCQLRSMRDDDDQVPDDDVSENEGGDT